MKTLALLICALGLGLGSLAQNIPTAGTSQEDAILCKRYYITLGSGLNSNFGIIGVGADIGITEKIQLAGGVGIGTWGIKSGAEVRYFYSGCQQKGSALSLGIQHASGLPEFESDLEVASGQTKTVKMKLKPQNNVQVSWYHAFRTSERTRFFIQAGYSFALTSGSAYEVLSNERLSDTSETAVELLIPGGVLIAMGLGISLD